MLKTLTLLILTAIVMASVACGTKEPPVLPTPYPTYTPYPTPTTQPTPYPTYTPYPTPTIQPTPYPTLIVIPTPTIQTAENLKQQKERAELLSERGYALSATGNYEQAVAVFDEAIQLWPHHDMYAKRGEAHSMMASRFGNLGLHEQALRHMEQCVADIDAALRSSHEMSKSGIDVLNTRVSLCKQGVELSISTFGFKPTSPTDTAGKLKQQKERAELLLIEGEEIIREGWTESIDCIDCTKSLQEFQKAVEMFTESIGIWPRWDAYWYKARAHRRIGLNLTKSWGGWGDAIPHFSQCIEDSQSALESKDQISKESSETSNYLKEVEDTLSLCEKDLVSSEKRNREGLGDFQTKTPEEFKEWLESLQP